jgi:anti-sigma regulatory factor (Ser/Thr protein kinase)
VTTVSTSTPLPTGTMAVPAARRFTSDLLAAWPVSAETREHAELVVSELVGNAVQHGEGIAELCLALCEGVLRIEVVDNSTVLPVMLRPEPAGDRHRGLLIVATLSTDWGTRRVANGKTVWAELPAAATGRTAEITTTEITATETPAAAPTLTSNIGPDVGQDVGSNVTEIAPGRILRPPATERSATA